MVTWLELIANFEDTKGEFDRTYKCLNVKRKLLEETFNKHKVNIIEQYNDLINIYTSNYKLLSADHKLILENELFILRDRLLNLFTRLTIDTSVPYSIKEKINIDTRNPFLEELLYYDLSNNLNTMVQSKKDFIKDNSRIIPDFDGDIDHLQKFIDALTLVKEDVGEHERTAVSLIKTKLGGNARTCITDADNSIDKIIDRLTNNVKGETSDVLMGRLMNLKQLSKPANLYTEELIIKSLKAAYVEDGMSFEMADKLSTKDAIRAMRQNASNDEVKFIMKAGNFTEINEAVSKFITASNDQQSKNILYMNTARNNFRGNFRGSRGYRPFRQTYQRNHFNNNQRFRNGYQRNNFQQNNRSFRGQYSNNFQRNGYVRQNDNSNSHNGNRRVRVMQEEQGNLNDSSVWGNYNKRTE